jgi:hypothetical protein
MGGLNMLLSVVTAVILSAAAPTGRPTLTGVVRNADGKPLPGALVFVSTARPRQGTSTTCPSCYLDCRKRATSGADGSFTIASLDPSLLFKVGAAADGHLAAFARDVDPAAGPLSLSLAPEPAAPSNPRQLVRGRIVDQDGEPVVGALVDPQGYRIEVQGPRPSWTDSFGPFGVDPTVTGTRGQFTFALPQPADSLYVSVEARGLAPKAFGGVATGAEEGTLRLGVGRSIRGRIVHAGRAVAGASIGVAQISRAAGTFVGERTAETDREGRFFLLNVPPDEPVVLYGKVGGMGEAAALAEVEVAAAPNGNALDLGELAAETGVFVEGQVVLADGRPVPPKTRIGVGRTRAWDYVEADVAPNGDFRVGPFPLEQVEVSIRVPGYELSPENVSLLPDFRDERMSLAGRLGRDPRLKIVLVPATDRPRSKPPRTGQEWAEFNAKQQAVRSRELQGVPVR